MSILENGRPTFKKCFFVHDERRHSKWQSAFISLWPGAVSMVGNSIGIEDAKSFLHDNYCK